MARTIPLLDAAQRREFDHPPRLSHAQQTVFFDLPEWALHFLSTLVAPHSKGGFALQVGYFKATGRFFPVDRFARADLQFVQLRYHLAPVDWSRYDGTTSGHHRQYILRQFGVAPFADIQTAVLQQVTHFARHQMHPVSVFRSAAAFIRSHRWEVPTYAALAGVVTEAFRAVERRLTIHLAQHLTLELREQLNALFVPDGEGAAQPHRPYRLTTLKRSLELMRPTAIRANVRDYRLLKALFAQVQPVVQALDLSEELVRFYARYVERARVFQVAQQPGKKYLMVICFVVYQYYRLGDILTETLLQVVQTHRNAAQRETKERVYRQQQDAAGRLQQVLDGVVAHGTALDALERSAFSFAHTHEEKVAALLAWLQSSGVAAFRQLPPTARALRPGVSAAVPYYAVVEERSLALQRRLVDLLRAVDYEAPAGSRLGQALAHLQNRTSSPPPEEFLKAAERTALDAAGSRISLYKALLAGHVADQLKAGKLNLPHSLGYRAFESYLLDAATWATQRDQLLERTGLMALRDPGPWLDTFQHTLAQAFACTYERLNAGTNPAVRTRADGRPRFLTPAAPLTAESVAPPRSLFPDDRFTPLHEVLHTVNQHCRFTDCLEHWSPRHRREPPADHIFFAGLMAYGCNLGLANMAHAAKQVPLATLENTVNWYFSVDNLRRANDAIVALMGRLPIGRLFQRLPPTVHTASDGQKYYVAVDSIHANYSYKYFRQEKGIVLYSFIDDRHRLFYSTTFSSSEREAPYVLDGLLHNDVVESTLHSTDTHGFTEVNFALTHLLGIAFAPRIKDFQGQQLYAFAGMSLPDLTAYTLTIGKPLDRALIEAQWDTLLRLVVSLKQKHVTASAVLRRLNSYSQHHPVYLALRELGRAVRTEFLLRYMDDGGLRKRIDDQLDRLESAHQFARAVFYARNGQVRAATKEEHLLTDACKRLLQNAIICWNYLYLTNRLVQAPAAERAALTEAIARASPVSWQHINLQGEFDFSDDALKDSLRFDLAQLVDFKWETTIPPMPN